MNPKLLKKMTVTYLNTPFQHLLAETEKKSRMVLTEIPARDLDGTSQSLLC